MPGRRLSRVWQIPPTSYLISFGSCVDQDGLLQNRLVFTAEAVFASFMCPLYSPSFNPVVLCLRAHSGPEEVHSKKVWCRWTYHAASWLPGAGSSEACSLSCARASRCPHGHLLMTTSSIGFIPFPFSLLRFPTCVSRDHPNPSLRICFRGNPAH